MNFSKQLESMVYTTPVVKEQTIQPSQESNKKPAKVSNKDMLNELGLAIKRR